MFHHGEYKTIDVAGPYSQTEITSFNGRGQIVGEYTDTEGITHGFVGTPVAR